MYYEILKRLLEKLRDNFERLNIDALIPTNYCPKTKVKQEMNIFSHGPCIPFDESMDEIALFICISFFN